MKNVPDLDSMRAAVLAVHPSAVQDAFGDHVWWDDARNNHTILAPSWEAAYSALPEAKVKP